MKARQQLKHVTLAVLALVSLLSTGCVTPSGKTGESRNADALRIRDEALTMLYERQPEAKAVIESAPGYLFTSGGAFHPGIMTFARGWGVVQDNVTKEQSFITYWRFGLGPGLAAKGNFAFLVMDSRELLDTLGEQGGTNAGILEASFKFGSFGGSATANSGAKGIRAAYGWTHTGFALESFWIWTRHKPVKEL